ncbi:MAG TPA: sugar phosphate isomerase/epimerase [Clostridia bacterium]|nr:sugar phosphate isomerase/epimerase [Clostridia bacterium]
MKLSFSTLCCPDWTLAEIFSAAKDLGYQGVEIRGVLRELDATKSREFTSELEKTLAELKRLNLTIPVLATNAALAESEKGYAEAADYIALAAKIGAPYVRVMSTGRPQPTCGDITLCRKQYAKLVKLGAEAGVTPLIETNGLFCDTRLLKSFLETTGGGALLDVHHPYRFGGEEPEESFENLKAFIRHVHIKDSVLENDRVRYKVLGAGDIPVAQCVKTLTENGFSGFFSLEWVKRWEPGLEDGGVVIASYPHYMRSL